jgi:hypothetical protein
MKDSNFQDFNEEALEALDFARCQRADGSFYGTSGQCRKGSPTGAKEKAAPKAKATPKRDDSKDIKRGGTVIGTSPRNMLIDNIKTLEGRLKDSRSEQETKLLKDSITKAKAKLAKEDKAAKPAAKPAPKADSKATQANVRKMDQAAKAADKKADTADKAYQRAEKDARRVESRAAKAQAALRKDPQNQGKKDAFRVANMDARNARDRAAILGKQTRKLDKEAKRLNKAASQLDKEWRKSQGIK